MPKTNVLYLTYDGLTDPLGQSQILPYILGLSKNGFDFTVLSFEKPKQFSKLFREIDSICVENGIAWVPLTYHKSPPILSTLYDLLMLWHKTEKTYAKKKFEIVHCRSYITS